MRKNKVALLLVLVLALTLSFGIVANAAIICPCGGSMLLSGTTYGPWVATGVVAGNDYEYERTVTKTYTCNNCGAEHDSISTQTSWF